MQSRASCFECKHVEYHAKLPSLKRIHLISKGDRRPVGSCTPTSWQYVLRPGISSWTSEARALEAIHFRAVSVAGLWGWNPVTPVALRVFTQNFPVRGLPLLKIKCLRFGVKIAPSIFSDPTRSTTALWHREAELHGAVDAFVACICFTAMLRHSDAGERRMLRTRT